MHIPGVGNLKTYLKKRWNRSSTRPVRPGRFKADPRRIHELSSESPEETAMFRYVFPAQYDPRRLKSLVAVEWLCSVCCPRLSFSARIAQHCLTSEIYVSSAKNGEVP